MIRIRSKRNASLLPRRPHIADLDDMTSGATPAEDACVCMRIMRKRENHHFQFNDTNGRRLLQLVVKEFVRVSVPRTTEKFTCFHERTVA